MRERLDPLMNPTCTIDECARLFGIARGSAYAAAKVGELPTIRLGRRLLVPTAALARMLALEGFVDGQVGETGAL